MHSFITKEIYMELSEMSLVLQKVNFKSSSLFLDVRKFTIIIMREGNGKIKEMCETQIRRELIRPFLNRIMNIKL